MPVTIALPLLFGAITAALLWFNRVSAGSALLVFLCGFETAGTGLAGPVNQLLTSLVHTLGH
ncbi:hypothetical protein ACIGXM_03715 [Kitasatospora sp. NPDC052896]|uniref:hypothetical protein n=1 Tax=Kitasatospora sp. NPDC052896 TaxID=3364061 RepID=UPI0037C818C7